MSEEVKEYAVIDVGGKKQIVPVVEAQQMQPAASQQMQPAVSQQMPVPAVDPFTAILLAPFYFLQALVMLPVITMANLSKMLAMQQMPQYNMPRMVITEVVRDEKGRIMQVVERVQ